MTDNFGNGEPFTVGVEQELLLVDDETYELRPAAKQIASELSHFGDQVGLEAFASEIELRSKASANAAQAASQLGELRLAAQQAGATLLACGLHPTAQLGTAELLEHPRYSEVEKTMRGLIRRTPEAALHVHVGMPDRETAIRVYNGLRADLPLLIALAANSPVWFGRDSGLASARYTVVRAYPRRGVPPFFNDFDHYLEVISDIVTAGELVDYTFVWWDIRPHPNLGTIEIRELDSQMSLSSIAAIAAFIQTRAYELASTTEQLPPSEVIAESCFRASRDGLDATIMDSGSFISVRELIQKRCRQLEPIARELGNEDALRELEQILRTGNGAQFQRNLWDPTNPSLLLKPLIAATRAPLR